MSRNPRGDKDSISMLIAFLFVVQTIAMILLAEYVVVFSRYISCLVATLLYTGCNRSN
jgi:hypothetical protein